MKFKLWQSADEVQGFIESSAVDKHTTYSLEEENARLKSELYALKLLLTPSKFDDSVSST